MDDSGGLGSGFSAKSTTDLEDCMSDECLRFIPPNKIGAWIFMGFWFCFWPNKAVQPTAARTAASCTCGVIGFAGMGESRSAAVADLSR